MNKQAYLTITRSSHDTMVIEIRDDKRNRQIIELSLADFTLAITGKVMKVEIEEKEGK